MGDTPTADEARAATLEREKLSALAFRGVIPFHANDSGGRAAPPVLNQAVAARQERANAEEEHGLESFRAVGTNLHVGFVGGTDVDQERHEPWGKDDDEQDAPPSREAGPSAPKRSTKKATKATGGSSTKKATKATGGSKQLGGWLTVCRHVLRMV
eukprot:jgi/Tetstr1/435931/TSEL_024813.t1